jgi:predicted TIM-barrel fold metal-dependent hydrolase
MATTPEAGATPALRERARLGVSLRATAPPIIDGHCHLGPHAGFFQPRNGAGALLRTMDRIGIDRACVFASLAVRVDMRGGNDLSLAAAARHPDRFLAYAVVDPHRGDEIEAELARCFDRGARGIKLHTQLAGYPFDGPAYERAFAFADEHRLPLISHGVGSATALRRIARAYPNAHFVVAHAGAALVGADASLATAAAEVSNVYLDTASSTAPFGAFAAVVRLVGAAKLTFGTDAPLTSPAYQVGRIALAPLSEADQRRILGGNLAALLATRR